MQKIALKLVCFSSLLLNLKKNYNSGWRCKLDVEKQYHTKIGAVNTRISSFSSYPLKGQPLNVKCQIADHLEV